MYRGTLVSYPRSSRATSVRSATSLCAVVPGNGPSACIDTTVAAPSGVRRAGREVGGVPAARQSERHAIAAPVGAGGVDRIATRPIHDVAVGVPAEDMQ